MEKLLALVFTYFFRTYTWNNGEVISESDTLVNLDVYVCMKYNTKRVIEESGGLGMRLQWNLSIADTIMTECLSLIAECS